MRWFAKANAWQLMAALAVASGLIAAGCDRSEPDLPPPPSIEPAEASGQQAATPSESKPWFESATEGSGIDFVHDSGNNPERPFPAANGSGVGMIDFDLDGHVVVGNVLFGEGQALSDDLADLRVFDIDISRLVNKSSLFDYLFGGSDL